MGPGLGQNGFGLTPWWSEPKSNAAQHSRLCADGADPGLSHVWASLGTQTSCSGPPFLELTPEGGVKRSEGRPAHERLLNAHRCGERRRQQHDAAPRHGSPPSSIRATAGKSPPKLFALARSRVGAERDDSAHAHVGGRIHRLVRAPRRGSAGMARPPNVHACSVPHARNRATTHAKPAPTRRLKEPRSPRPPRHA
jgi:hypothetical protein